MKEPIYPPAGIIKPPPPPAPPKKNSYVYTFLEKEFEKLVNEIKKKG